MRRVKEKTEKAGLKFNMQETKIMASSPITSWQIGEKLGTVIDFNFGGFKIIADGDSRHEIQRLLLLRRKAMTNLDRVLKNGDVTADKGPYSQSYGFSSSHAWL